MMKKLGLMAMLVMGCFQVAVFAQDPDESHVLREDIRYIRNWERDQRIKQLAVDLGLSDAQVATLQSTRAGVDAVKAEFEPRIAEKRTALEELAHRVRTGLEAGGALAESDKTQLRALGQELKALKREQGAAIKPVAENLVGLFTEPQKALIRERIRSWHQSDQADRPGRDDQGPRGPQRDIKSTLKELLKMVLSDAFLAGATSA